MLEKFIKDEPRGIAEPAVSNNGITIESVRLLELGVNSDSRGDLIELMTTRNGEEIDFHHAYQVIAEPGSLRGWVYHKLQSDRLYFTQGDFEVELVDLSKESPTFRHHMILRVGANRPVCVTIPPYVAHSVLNRGKERAGFINIPTRVYDPGDPDKYRLEAGVEELIGES